MAYDGSAWDENNPTNSTLANEIDDVAVDMKIGVRSRMQNEHAWPAVQTGTNQAGQHLFVTLQPQTGAPTLPVVGTTTQIAAIWASSGSQNLLIKASNATSYVLFNSSAGAVNISAGYYSATAAVGDVLIGSAGGLKVLVASATNLALITRAGTADPNWQAVLLLSNPNTVTGLVTFATNIDIGGNSVTNGFLGVASQSTHAMSNGETYMVPAGYYINGVKRGGGGEIDAVYFAKL